MTMTSLATTALADLARDLAAERERWQPHVRHTIERRCYQRLLLTEDYDAWLIGWWPGQGIAAHDHGQSAGALVVTEGRLVERRWTAGREATMQVLGPDSAPAVFGPEAVHALANLDAEPATSIHVYAPALSTMRWFIDQGDELRVRAALDVTAPSSHPRTVDAVLDHARERLVRLAPGAAYAAASAGALLVDIRPETYRRAEGAIPGALVIERNVLEWRLDPASPARLPQIVDHEAKVVLVCNEGYASSLAAASLQDLGLVNATDLDGGFRAWRAEGLPVEEAR